MTYQKELDQILIAAETFDEAVFSLADMVHWQDDALDHFVEKKILQRTKPASEAECDGCEEKCVEKVVFIDGKKPSDTRAYIVCRMRDDMRPIAVDMERLKRWKANKDKLIELGYCKEPAKPAGTGGNPPKKKGRPPKYSPDILEAMIKVYEDKYRDKGDSKGAWSAAAKIGKAPSGDAARIACTNYKKNKLK